ncbi:MAG: CHAT domain-containing protein [Chitinophagales bacterium]
MLATNAKEKYDKAIEVALLLSKVQAEKEKEYQDIAFNFAEQSKALVLLSKFKDVEASSNSNIPSDLLQELKQIRIELNYLNKQLKPESSSKTGSQKELQSQYFDYKQQYYALIEKLEKEYPDYFHLKYATETVTIPQLQNHLQSTTAIIEYSIAEHHVFSFFIDKQQIRTHQIVKPSNFDKILLQHQRAINTGSASKFVKTSTQLYEWLIAPFEVLIEDKQRLVFIPDENLHQLCFDTLVNQNTITKITFADLPYLIKDFEISHHYSATLLLHIAQKRQHTQKQTDSFLGLAPITFNKNNTQSTGYIVKSEINSPKKAKPIILKSGGNHEESLMDLEASEVEVKKVFNLFHKQNLESLALFYEEASKSNLQKLAKNYKYVLISTHGFVNKSQPNLSGLYLSKPNLTKTTDLEEDASKLYLSDAYQLSLTADLVVLSSCESGIGEVLKGEGMIALNRSFLYAGASNVIYSLFKVPQDSTSELVQALFHHIIHQKCTYSQALRLAKLQLIEAGGELRDWAGFALLGI